jgi:hypothetical protein
VAVATRVLIALGEDHRECVRSWSGPVNWAIAEQAARATGVESRWAPVRSRALVTPHGVVWTSIGITGFSESFE